MGRAKKDAKGKAKKGEHHTVETEGWKTSLAVLACIVFVVAALIWGVPDLK